jgi:hypothetical protein
MKRRANFSIDTLAGKRERAPIKTGAKPSSSMSMPVLSPEEQVLHLQRTIGNRAVERLIRVHGAAAAGVIQRIPKSPSGIPFDGEIIPWSAALRRTPKKDPAKPYDNIIADLPRGHKVRVLGGKAWIFVKTHINDKDRVGYVSYELIKKVAGTTSPAFTTDKGNPISTSSGAGVPTLAYEKKWMKDHGLDTKVTRVPNSATSDYNCHGFVYLNAMAWTNDPTPIIKDNDYFVPAKPEIGDAVVYTKSAPTLDKDRKPTFSGVPPHSGLVSRGSKGSPSEVTSKWGSWHIYKHKPADVWSEYGSPTYLRSARKGGHTVKIT